MIVSYRSQQTQEPYLVGLSYAWLPLKHSSLEVMSITLTEAPKSL